MIPKRIHRIWLGPRPIPQVYERYWSAWRRQLPDAEFRTWREEDVRSLPLAGPLLARAASPVQQADIARYDIIYQEGGVYLDCDVMPIAYPDFFSTDELVTCNQDDADQIRSVGFFAAPAGHPALKMALDLIEKVTLGTDKPNVETGPVLFRKAITVEKRLPKEAFYPYHHTEPFSRIFDRDLSRTFGIHVWGRSWLSDEAITTAAAHCFHAGDIAEAEALLVQRPEPITIERAQRLLEMCRYIRSVRSSLMQACRWPLFRSTLRKGWLGGLQFPSGPRPSSVSWQPGVPSLFELLWHIFARNPAAVIWQVGACDGILNDPIRPFLANFDPTAVLIEPHPELFTRLKANYRFNERAVFLNAAVRRETGDGELIAISPELIEREGLPDWTLGISSMYGDRNALGGKGVTKKLQARLRRTVRKLPVEVLSPADVRRRTGSNWPDILVVDAEGCDAEIVSAFLDERVQLKLVYLETACIPPVEIEGLRKRVSSTHFIIELPQNMVLVRFDILDEVLETALVEQGRLLMSKFLGTDIFIPGLEVFQNGAST